MPYDDLKKALERSVKADKEQQHDENLMLTDDFARLMQESKTIKRVVDGDEPYSPQVEEILHEQCQSLGLDPEAMSIELQRALACEECLLYTDMSPRAELLRLLSEMRLGPAGSALYGSLDRLNRLTEDQVELLEKICGKLGHPGWMKPILQETDGLNEALDACNEGCISK